MSALESPAGPFWRPRLASGQLVLRPPQAADIDARMTYGRHPEIDRMYGGSLQQPARLSREAAEQWYARMCADPLAWVIETEGHCVGVVRLHSLVEQDRRARLAIGLFHPDLLGRGTGTLAIRLLLRHAFETLRLQRVPGPGSSMGRLKHVLSSQSSVTELDRIALEFTGLLRGSVRAPSGAAHSSANRSRATTGAGGCNPACTARSSVTVWQEQ